jgi:F-type H+-transporting ATPase subunit epsilon
MNKGSFHLSILSAEKILFDGDVKYLYVPAAEGYMGILPDHASLISSLTPGKIELRPLLGPSVIFFLKGNGLLEVHRNVVSLLVDTIDSSSYPVALP